MMRRATSAAAVRSSMTVLDMRDNERESDVPIPTLTWPPEPLDNQSGGKYKPYPCFGLFDLNKLL